jgi:hypothetical protein
MAWGQDFLKGFVGFDGLKDYRHAAKTFLQNGYENAPRQKFLFHVYFTINVVEIPALRSAFPSSDTATIGLMVKTAQLPSYQMSVETLNQYNRKRLAQTKIEYNPVQIEFHDDGSDLIRNMWYNYFKYYYKDPSQAYDNVTNQNGQMAAVIGTPAGFSYNARDIYSQNRAVNDWGYIGEAYNDGYTRLDGTSSGKPPFFKDIRIYGMNQRKFAEYILINPMITDWQHDTYDYSQGAGIMSHRMTVKYETVKYYTGAIGGVRPDTNVKGFADPAYYDTIPSALARPGSTQTVLGQGGLLDAGIGIVSDLESGGVGGLIGATQKALTAYNTFKNVNLKSVVNAEVNQAINSTIRGALPGILRGASSSPLNSPLGIPNQPLTYGSGGIFFPTPPAPAPAYGKGTTGIE